jgi:hypothetical protein
MPTFWLHNSYDNCLDFQPLFSIPFKSTCNYNAEYYDSIIEQIKSDPFETVSQFLEYLDGLGNSFILVKAMIVTFGNVLCENVNLLRNSKGDSIVILKFMRYAVLFMDSKPIVEIFFQYANWKSNVFYELVEQHIMVSGVFIIKK